MTPKQVLSKYKTIRKHISHWHDELDKLQDACQHLNVAKKYFSSTGNYDPTSDCYWISWSCPDCSKIWSTDQ